MGESRPVVGRQIYRLRKEIHRLADELVDEGLYPECYVLLDMLEEVREDVTSALSLAELQAKRQRAE